MEFVSYFLLFTFYNIIPKSFTQTWGFDIGEQLVVSRDYTQIKDELEDKIAEV